MTKKNIFSKEKFNTIFVLGGGLIQENNTWRLPKLNEGDTFGATGDGLRTVAAATLFHHNIANIIYVSGGKGQYKHIQSAPNISAIMKQDLLARKVTKKHIVEESKSENTFRQLQKIFQIIKNGGSKHVGIISNRWHIPRIKAFINHTPELSLLKKNSSTISAETILQHFEAEQWASEIEKMYKSSDIKRRVKLENQGINDIKNGNYILS